MGGSTTTGVGGSTAGVGADTAGVGGSTAGVDADTAGVGGCVFRGGGALRTRAPRDSDGSATPALITGLLTRFLTTPRATCLFCTLLLIIIIVIVSSTRLTFWPDQLH